ncbi:MalY/PatB family protein [Halopseudomonas salegens]|uniref:cysteine-S-conjugate beta-lyase n=1 Tax=Halopseudomonas salegens TaxID=1434072 RepID=A0A1H2EQK1_9GAMM|nr:PatB family C-S lyase [Halopseudomonas salegens]SDT97365.1 cystathione beta-lyase [Halopseudomonas salegens]
MVYDFDLPVSRQGSASLKHDALDKVFGAEDILPLWVADMDFPAPPAVTKALLERASHAVYGYTLFPPELTHSLMDWFAQRHSWQVQPQWVVMAPGVVPSLHAAAMAFAQPGQGIIVQSPVYPPFFAAVEKTGRRLLVNPLREEQGRYEMDFEHLEACMQDDARVLFLCSPHNPVGRVWTREELQRLLALAERYNNLIMSDDIHCDLVYPGQRHQMLADLPGAEGRVITAVAPSKSFNIPGMGLSALIIPDAGQRRAIEQVFASLCMQQANPFSVTAFAAAYREGGPWLDALIDYLQDNRDRACELINQQLAPIRVQVPESTYLLWLDCRELGWSDQALKRFFVQQAKVGLNPGISFGAAGSGFMRLNIGTQWSVIEQAIKQVGQALKARG